MPKLEGDIKGPMASLFLFLFFFILGRGHDLRLVQAGSAIKLINVVKDCENKTYGTIYIIMTFFYF